MRFYIDFCRKYRHPPRSESSIGPFLEKLAAKGQPELLRMQAERAELLLIKPAPKAPDRPDRADGAFSSWRVEDGSAPARLPTAAGEFKSLPCRDDFPRGCTMRAKGSATAVSPPRACGHGGAWPSS